MRRMSEAGPIEGLIPIAGGDFPEVRQRTHYAERAPSDKIRRGNDGQMAITDRTGLAVQDIQIAKLAIASESG